MQYLTIAIYANLVELQNLHRLLLVKWLHLKNRLINHFQCYHKPQFVQQMHMHVVPLVGTSVQVTVVLVVVVGQLPQFDARML